MRPAETIAGPNTANFTDVLDRVLDRGVVIDSWARVAGEAIQMPRTDVRVPTQTATCPTCGAVMKEIV